MDNEDCRYWIHKIVLIEIRGYVDRRQYCPISDTTFGVDRAVVSASHETMY